MIEVDGNGSEFLDADGLEKNMDAAFIPQISKSFPDKIRVIAGDGAGCHYKEGQDQQETLRVMFVS